MNDYPKILIHKGKHGDTLILCLNENKEQEAWLAMFHAIDQWEGYYDRYIEAGRELKWRDAARNGCWQAAKWLLEVRSLNEYEGVELELVYEPKELLQELNVQPCCKCKKFIPEEKMRPFGGSIFSNYMPAFICKPCDPREKNHEV